MFFLCGSLEMSCARTREVSGYFAGSKCLNGINKKKKLMLPPFLFFYPRKWKGHDVAKISIGFCRFVVFSVESLQGVEQIGKQPALCFLRILSRYFLLWRATTRGDSTGP